MKRSAASRARRTYSSGVLSEGSRSIERIWLWPMTIPEKNSAAWSKFSTLRRPSSVSSFRNSASWRRAARGPASNTSWATSGISFAPIMITRIIE